MTSGEYYETIQYKHYGVLSINIPINIIKSPNVEKLSQVSIYINHKVTDGLKPGINNFMTLDGTIASLRVKCLDTGLQKQACIFLPNSKFKPRPKFFINGQGTMLTRTTRISSFSRTWLVVFGYLRDRTTRKSRQQSKSGSWGLSRLTRDTFYSTCL
jgi:hypothetical protein